MKESQKKTPFLLGIAQMGGRGPCSNLTLFQKWKKLPKLRAGGWALGRGNLGNAQKKYEDIIYTLIINILVVIVIIIISILGDTLKGGEFFSHAGRRPETL